jgi:hypothetical protein
MSAPIVNGVAVVRSDDGGVALAPASVRTDDDGEPEAEVSNETQTIARGP